MITQKRYILTRSILTVPLLFFIGAFAITTLLSIDFTTSLFGYYSRFHGGLVSYICYALLFFIYVSTMGRRETIISIKTLLFSSIFVCIYAILQRFGIDRDMWVQDVQSRVFSTFGQPNWLAAWLVAILPLTWAFYSLPNDAETKISDRDSSKKENNQPTIGFFYNWISTSKEITRLPYLLLSILFFTVLLFTKSRSGLLGFAVACFIFGIGILIFARIKKQKTTILKTMVPLVVSYLSLVVIIGTPWTPSIGSLLGKTDEVWHESELLSQTSLETGGTESGEIRKIVWQGAITIWKNYPIFGTGPETFAFAYYQFKPSIHNYTSEWDFLYNKAHNEYLHFLATTGVVGFGAYLFLTFSIIILFKKQYDLTLGNENGNRDKYLHFALLSGFVSILVTNFFGFSVVGVALLFFLYPAFSHTLAIHENRMFSKSNVSETGKIAIGLVLIVSLFLIWNLGKYWYADYLYAEGRRASQIQEFAKAQKLLTDALSLSSNEPLYWDELANIETNLAIVLSESQKPEEALKFAEYAVRNTNRAVELSPANVNLLRSQATYFTKLSGIDQNLLINAHATLSKARKLAPTDPKLQYAYAASIYRLGRFEEAVHEMEKVVEMKRDYKDARYALGLMYLDIGEKDKAKQEFTYILENIDPESEPIKKELEELKTN